MEPESESVVTDVETDVETDDDDEYSEVVEDSGTIIPNKPKRKNTGGVGLPRKRIKSSVMPTKTPAKYTKDRYSLIKNVEKKSFCPDGVLQLYNKMDGWIYCQACSAYIVASQRNLDKHLNRNFHQQQTAKWQEHKKSALIQTVLNKMPNLEDKELQTLLVMWILSCGITLNQFEKLSEDGVLMTLLLALNERRSLTRRALRFRIGDVRNKLEENLKLLLSGFSNFTVSADEGRNTFGNRMLTIKLYTRKEEYTVATISVNSATSIDGDWICNQEMAMLQRLGIALKKIVGAVSDNASYMLNAHEKLRLEVERAEGSLLMMRDQMHCINLCAEGFADAFPVVHDAAITLKQLVNGHEGEAQQQRQAIFFSNKVHWRKFVWGETRFLSKIKAIHEALNNTQQAITTLYSLNDMKGNKEIHCVSRAKTVFQSRGNLIQLYIVDGLLGPLLSVFKKTQSPTSLTHDDLAILVHTRKLTKDLVEGTPQIIWQTLADIVPIDRLHQYKSSNIMGWNQLLSYCRNGAIAFNAQYDQKIEPFLSFWNARMYLLYTQQAKSELLRKNPNPRDILHALGAQQITADKIGAMQQYFELLLVRSLNSTQDGWDFWKNAPKEHILLQNIQELAQKVLTCSPSSAGCERDFSLMNHLQNKRRGNSLDDLLETELMVYANSSTAREYIKNTLKKSSYGASLTVHDIAFEQ